jgi:hypothetical protein
LISLSETCLIDCLRFLKKETRVNFLVTPAVKHEIVSRPIQIPEYAFSAVRLKKLLEDGIADVVSVPDLAQKTKRVLSVANKVYSVAGTPLEVLHEGEAESLAVFQGIDASALLVDEKTTRLMVENPLKLRERISGEYRHGVQFNEGPLREWREIAKDLTILRSSELLAVAGECGFFDDYGGSADEALNAAFIALRNAGCSLTSDELREYREMKLLAKR